MFRRYWAKMSFVAFTLAALFEISCLTAQASTVSTTLSRITNGISSQQANWGSRNLTFSDDGRYAVFESDASNLVSGDDNGVSDIFLFDTQTSTMTLLSAGLSSADANGPSFSPVISGNGSYVVFASFATNLVASDTNKTADVFRVNLSNGTIARLSVSSAGVESNGPSGEPSISQDGTLVAFTSKATNLVVSDTNAVSDVFLRDIGSSTTSRLSVSSSSVQGNQESYEPRISADGLFIAFTSDATNLIGTDTNACSDIFVRDLAGGTTQIVSASTAGTIGNRSSSAPSISETGRYVTFQSRASNLIASDLNGYIDVFRKDRSNGTTILISQTDAGTQAVMDSGKPTISLDGRFVVFESRASNFVGFDTNSVVDVFIHDTLSELTAPFSTLGGVTIGNNKSIRGRISGDGTKLGFETFATNLVTTDTNGQYDLLVRSNPLSGQVVNVTPLGSITESGGSQNALLFTRYGSTAGALTITYGTSGTATSGTDYTALSGTLTIPAASPSVTIPVNVSNDSNAEGTELLQVSLSENSSYFIGGKGIATVSIVDDDLFTVSIVATDNVLFEDGVNLGNFRISRSGGTLGNLSVNLVSSGSATSAVDYVALPASVIIPDGQSYVDLSAIGLTDGLAEGDETITVSLSVGTGYTVGSSSSATATLKDNEQYQVSVTAIDAIADESSPSDTGQLRFDRGVATGESLLVYYSLKGTAHNGVDYQALTGVATIASSAQYADVTVTPITDSNVEGFESVIAEVLPGSLYSVGKSSEATVVIREDSNLPIVSIESTDASANESGSDVGTARISRTGSTSGNLVVQYAVGGTALNGVDYATLSGVATIASGQTYVDVSISGIEDSIVESTESVILALNATSSYLIDIASSRAQINILDNDAATVQIFRKFGFATESQSEKAKFQISRAGNIASSLVVNLTYSGEAVAGTDYTSAGTSVTLSGGEVSKEIELAAISDSVIEGVEKVHIAIDPSGSYSIGTSGAIDVSVVDRPTKIFEEILSLTPNDEISSVSVSDNGRFIAFSSAATNLVTGDNNGVSDIFVIDMNAHSIQRVMALGGAEPNGSSRNPRISADGSAVVFSSLATNFYALDYNQKEDVFLVNLNTQGITYVSKGYTDLSVGGSSLNPSLPPSASFVAFESRATNLVSGDTNGASDIFVFNRLSGLTERVSLKAGSVQFTNDSFRPAVSDDGNIIAFESKEQVSGDSDSYTDVIVRNQSADTAARASAPSSGTSNDGSSSEAAVASDGKTLFFQSTSSKVVSGDSNSTSDVFRFTVASAAREIVSRSARGEIGDKSSVKPKIDSNGGQVLFLSSATNLGGSFNCTTSAYIKSVFQKDVSPIENGSLKSCSSPVKDASLSNSGRFAVATVAGKAGFNEITISGNPLK